MSNKNPKVLFICSAGGHLAEVLELEKLRNKYEYLIVTEDIETTRPLSSAYNMQFLLPDRMGRGIPFYFDLLVNFFKSFIILIKFKPSVIITTGSHTAVPICLLGKVFNIKIIWILSYCRIKTKAKSANMIYPITDLFLVQWESAQKLYPKSLYKGGVF